jgi:DNA-binding LacI/PurR family transcriptional regulator
VVGYDVEIAEYVNLTTVRQPLFDSGWRGTHLLIIQAVDGVRSREGQEGIPVELVMRETTAAPCSSS